MGSLQKAWFYRDYGSVEVLEYGDVEVPQITSPDQVLIKVHAASLNPLDYKRRFGYIKSPTIPFPVSDVSLPCLCVLLMIMACFMYVDSSA